MIPGSNILNMALTVIASQVVTYLAYLSRTTNSIGYDVTAYQTPVDLNGSFQAVPRTQYENLGLDFNKTYFHFFVSKNVLDIERDVSGDLLQFQGNTYQCLSITPWYGIDGWVDVLCVLIPSFSGSILTTEDGIEITTESGVLITTEG